MNQLIQYVQELLSNDIFLSVLFSWAFSTFTKMSIILATEKNNKLSTLYRSGGMPSSHSAAVTGLTIGVLLSEGISTLFIITLAMATVIIHDAMGVRLESTKHAKFLNQLIKRHKFDRKYFTEHIGHNLPEVIVGVIIGIIIPLVIFKIEIFNF